MNKSALFFLVLSFVAFHFSFAQKAHYTQQEFVFSDVKLNESKTAFRSGIEFSFKVFGKYDREHIQAEDGRMFPSYSLMFCITNEQGDTLVAPSREKMLHSFSFFNVDTGKYRSYSFGHHITVPYQIFRKTGEQKIILWGQAQNANGTVKLTPFKTGPYKVFIPKLHPLEQQHIKVSGAQVSDDAKKYNDKGIVMKFSTQFAFDASELYSEKENRDEVIFFVEFTDVDGNPVNATFAPRIIHDSKHRSMHFSAPHKKNITKNAEIFVPYTQFFIPCGVQELRYTLHAVSYDYSKEWRNLTSGIFIINMPTVYFAKAIIKDIQAYNKSYDVAGKDIPILNIFVPSKGSSGKGYPDLFWTFGTKNTELIRTPVKENSLFAYNDSCSFQMLEDDVLFLDVYDFDTFSFNDVVGKFNFPKMVGPGTYSTTLKSGDVINGDIIIKRKNRPLGRDISITAESTTHNGITGYQVWGKHVHDASIRPQVFLRMPDGSKHTPAFTTLSNKPAGADFAYFIPAWDMPKGAGFGLLCFDTEYNLPVAQKYTAPEKYLDETNDVKIKLTSTPGTVKNGVGGILLEIDIEYPSGISNKKNCQFKYQLKEKSGVDLKKIIEQLKMTGAPDCGDAVCGMKVFVPYYLLSHFSATQLQTMFEATVSMKDKFTIGRLSEKVVAEIPAIIKLPKAQLSLDLKFAKNWSYINIATEYNGVEQVFVKEKTDGGKIEADLLYPSEFAAENDEISIVITPFEFRTPKNPIRWTFSAKDLKNGKVTLSKAKQVKKPSLKIY